MISSKEFEYAKKTTKLIHVKEHQAYKSKQLSISRQNRQALSLIVIIIFYNRLRITETFVPVLILYVTIPEKLNKDLPRISYLLN